MKFRMVFDNPEFEWAVEKASKDGHAAEVDAVLLQWLVYDDSGESGATVVIEFDTDTGTATVLRPPMEEPEI